MMFRGGGSQDRTTRYPSCPMEKVLEVVILEEFLKSFFDFLGLMQFRNIAG
jgi:hypothetical protein